MKQLIQRHGINPHNGFVFGDQLFFGHFNRHSQRGFGCPFARTGLQHVELILLDGELNILHVAIMGFQRLPHLT